MAKAQQTQKTGFSKLSAKPIKIPAENPVLQPRIIHRRSAEHHMLSRMAKLTGLNTPLLLGIALRVWSVFAGLITIKFVTAGMSAAVQGYYYTFGSLTQLTQLVDLGLQIVVVQFASHEAAHLLFGKGGRVSGIPRAMTRLASIGRFSLAWFGALSIVLIAGLIAAGYWIFSSRAGIVNWQSPWLLLCVLAAIDLWCNNFYWLLEGTNQLTVIYFYRFGRGVVSSLSLWFFLNAGYGLYALPLSMAAAIIFLIAVLLVSRLHFVLFFFQTHPTEDAISWRKEILPLQLRLGVSQITGFITYSLFVPITFRFVGPVAAGQMGLSWTPVDSMTGVALLWPAVIFPAMGALAAIRDWAKLDRVTLRVGLQAIALVILGSITLVLLRMGVTMYHFRLDGRLLPLLPFGLLALTAVPKVLASVMISYLRAHKKEPIVVLTAIVTPVMLSAVLWGAFHAGVLGIATAYFLVMTLLMLPGTAWILSAAARPGTTIISQPESGSARALQHAADRLFCLIGKIRPAPPADIEMADEPPFGFLLIFQKSARDAFHRRSLKASEKVIHIDDRAFLDKIINELEDRHGRFVKIAIHGNQGSFGASGVEGLAEVGRQAVGIIAFHGFHSIGVDAMLVDHPREVFDRGRKRALFQISTLDSCSSSGSPSKLSKAQNFMS